MKKIIGLLATTSLIASTTTAVVSCGDEESGFTTYKVNVYQDKDDFIGKTDKINFMIIVGNDYYANSEQEFKLMFQGSVKGDDNWVNYSMNPFVSSKISKKDDNNRIYMGQIYFNPNPSEDDKPEQYQKYKVSFSVENSYELDSFQFNYKEK
ncbi:hypothetical protein SLITO_v1c04120 [Spiroplasma litorale]|uniref:Lipoprotein n=1 Tax=Spiroplasma litorale TaxID=216942 RepID=A0A0K1W165_9MOLU|nr:lipoprotein [Spiroplasma litorale]AKX34065.1 hypothetical protein SLITO_v1c04120 [Spiroplasma litorale]